jgi:dTDP-4-amino-4,6-dideoxygalactose transaminase
VGPLEREYLLRALDSGWVAPVGPDLDAFEAEVAALTGWSGACAVSSGTAALHLALLVSGVRPGDDVVVSSFTFAASANAVVHAGARPVFVDSDAATWTMDPDLLTDTLLDARRRGRLPAAVVTVDLYGQCADYDRIVETCRELGVVVVEDAAEALGSASCDRPAGTLGDIGVFSFNGNKIITASGGGMVVAPDRAVTDRVRHLATQAREPAAHYEHREVGYNYRLSNLLAALGRAQLARLPDLMDRRKAVHEHYRALLADAPGLQFMPMAPWTRWNAWLTCVLFNHPEQRDAALARLAADSIESRPLWKPMHQQPVYATAEAHLTGVSDDLFARGLCLPSGSRLMPPDVERIAGHVKDALAA